MINLLEHIRTVKDFPVRGINFYDITTLLKEPNLFNECVNQILLKIKNIKIDKIAAIESRGFILGAPIAYNLNLGFIPIRKKGKLPAETISETYDLEYGNATLEMHKDSINNGDKVLLIDDVLATGGTAKVCQKMIKDLKGKLVTTIFLLELNFLKGRDKLEGNIISLINV